MTRLTGRSAPAGPAPTSPSECRPQEGPDAIAALIASGRLSISKASFRAARGAGDNHRRMASPQRLVFQVVAVIGGLAAALLAVKLGTTWLASTDHLRGTARAEEIGRARTAALAVLAGLIAAVGAVYTARTFRLNREGQITQRFSTAIEHLGSAETEVRLGGIYALERIARDSLDDHGPVVEVLTAYVRRRAPWPPMPASEDAGTPSEDDEQPRPAIDIQAVIAVLGRRDSRRDPHDLDLSSCDLRGAKFASADLGNFELAKLRGTQLQKWLTYCARRA